MSSFGLRIPEKKVTKSNPLFSGELKPTVAPKQSEVAKEPVSPKPSKVDLNFEYDEIYEKEATSAKYKAKLQEEPRNAGPKYMSNLIANAARRREERELTHLQMRREETKQLDGGNGKVFMTSAYKAKLEEMKQRGLDADATSEVLRDDAKRDTGKFYRNIMKQTTEKSFKNRERSPRR